MQPLVALILLALLLWRTAGLHATFLRDRQSGAPPPD